MIADVFKNYSAFYNMVLSTTIMTNALSKEFKDDAKKIICFIGKSFKLSDDFISESTSFILDKLVALGLTTDQQAIYSSREYGEEYSEEDALFDIKGDVLSKLQSLQKIESADVNASWFDYSHYKTYNAAVRFTKINIAGATGNIIATRQIGILRALGIGCEVDLNEALKRFTQCAFWGDIPSMLYLAYSYSLNNDKENSSLYYELAELSSKYLLAGYTVLPEKIKSEYSEKARLYYVYISTIKQDVVFAYNRFNIDFSFIEAVTSDSLDYFQKMNYINNYEKKEWKNVTNSSEKPSKKIGFK